MKLAVVSVGTRMPAWLEQGWSDYAKRMPPHLPLDLIEIEPGAPKKPHPARVEADRMRRAVPERAHRVALDAGPKPWSTEHLVTQLEAWLQVGDPVSFLIGGADGLDSVNAGHWGRRCFHTCWFGCWSPSSCIERGPSPKAIPITGVAREHPPDLGFGLAAAVGFVAVFWRGFRCSAGRYR
jgi:rRNA large subunit m3Psi methyltransferase RlmH